jgi:hypothetical protein
MSVAGQTREDEMKVLVIYESMYGNTHAVAEAIADGLGADVRAQVVPVEHADAAALDGVDLVVVGGPTHLHGMSTARSRDAAVEAAGKPDADLQLDEDAEGPGLREWFDQLDVELPAAAAFDTRMHGPVLVTGRASKGIAKRLVAHGAALVAEPKSFLVGKHNELDADEVERARDWGITLARAMRRGAAAT